MIQTSQKYKRYSAETDATAGMLRKGISGGLEERARRAKLTTLPRPRHIASNAFASSLPLCLYPTYAGCYYWVYRSSQISKNVLSAERGKMSGFEICVSKLLNCRAIPLAKS